VVNWHWLSCEREVLDAVGTPLGTGQSLLGHSFFGDLPRDLLAFDPSQNIAAPGPELCPCRCSKSISSPSLANCTLTHASPVGSQTDRRVRRHISRSRRHSRGHRSAPPSRRFFLGRLGPPSGEASGLQHSPLRRYARKSGNRWSSDRQPVSVRAGVGRPSSAVAKNNGRITHHI